MKKKGNTGVDAVCDMDTPEFSAQEWMAYTDSQKQELLLKYRLTYLAETQENWCPALGTVLANDEIIDGVSERGGHAVTKKSMRQWSMRIGAYAERLLQGLDSTDWPEPLKEMQRNWIGKSTGAMYNLLLKDIANKLRFSPPDPIPFSSELYDLGSRIGVGSTNHNSRTTRGGDRLY